MRAIKYVVFALLVLAVLEATVYPAIPHHLVRIALAGAFLAYGLWALLLLRKPAPEMALEGATAPTFTTSWRDLIRLGWRTVFLLVFRIAFMFCALAYLAQALAWYDSTILAPGSKRDFVSFLLAVFDQTFPPLTALCQFFVPEWRPVTWNYGHMLTLLLRLAAYLLFLVVVVSVLRKVWQLRGDLEQLDRRIAFGGKRYPTG